MQIIRSQSKATQVKPNFQQLTSEPNYTKRREALRQTATSPLISAKQFFYISFVLDKAGPH